MVVLTSECPSSSCTVRGSTENPGAGNTYGQATFAGASAVFEGYAVGQFHIARRTSEWLRR